MASSRAACVLGGVRLISSARTTLANSGPAGTEQRWPVVWSSWMTSVPRCRRHQVGRELDAAEAETSESARVRMMSVLARPGTPTRRLCPPAKMAMSSSSRTRPGRRWPADFLADVAVTVGSRSMAAGRRRCAARAAAAVGWSSASMGSTTGILVAGQPGAAAAQRRPPAGTCMARPQVLQRIFGIGIDSGLE